MKLLLAILKDSGEWRLVKYMAFSFDIEHAYIFVYTETRKCPPNTQMARKNKPISFQLKQSVKIKRFFQIYFSADLCFSYEEIKNTLMTYS